MAIKWLPFEPDAGYDKPSEFIHGRGLRPKCQRCKAPSEGGFYHGRSPSMVPERKWLHGYPGERVQ